MFLNCSIKQFITFILRNSVGWVVNSIVIPYWTCNVMDYTIFVFSQFTNGGSIENGNYGFESVKPIKIDGLNRLKTIKIVKKSSTQVYKNNDSTN